MDIKDTIVGAKVVIESLICLLENENVDISSIKFKVGSQEEEYESKFLSFESLVDLTLKELESAKAQMTESNALLSASLDAIQKLGSGDFVLVPKEPTLEMCHRGRNTQSFKVQDIYKAMIEAQEQSHD